MNAINSVGNSNISSQRDELWNSTYETYYDTFYEEIAADYLIIRWMKINDITNILIALTASGSLVSGWLLWSTPAGKTLWGIVAGVAAILAIINKSGSLPFCVGK